MKERLVMVRWVDAVSLDEVILRTNIGKLTGGKVVSVGFLVSEDEHEIKISRDLFLPDGVSGSLCILQGMIEEIRVIKEMEVDGGDDSANCAGGCVCSDNRLGNHQRAKGGK